ncbi:MAG: hypothetical protein JO112_10735 [Planctomycetes bacterium]|nr:hypothetical protein [Planctomycetota bacterium]
MNEHDAVAIAREFVGKQQIPFLRVERAFFVPVSVFDYPAPGLSDRWVVHFRTLPPAENEFDRLLSDDPSLLIVAVDVKTRSPSLLSSL